MTGWQDYSVRVPVKAARIVKTKKLVVPYSGDIPKNHPVAGYALWIDGGSGFGMFFHVDAFSTFPRVGDYLVVYGDQLPVWESREEFESRYSATEATPTPAVVPSVFAEPENKDSWRFYRPRDSFGPGPGIKAAPIAEIRPELKHDLTLSTRCSCLECSGPGCQYHIYLKPRGIPNEETVAVLVDRGALVKMITQGGVMPVIGDYILDNPPPYDPGHLRYAFMNKKAFEATYV